MDVSVIIPTHRRTDKLARCVERLARQDLDPGRFEVLIGIDGGTEQEAADLTHEIGQRVTGSIRLTIQHFEHAGPGKTRNRLAARASGRVLVLLNDDVLPEFDVLSRHAAAHAGRTSGAMIVGAAPWVRPAPSDDRLIDRLVRETSMIFFYDQMDKTLASGGADPEHDWGFRHAWTLNFSMSRALFERIGGFNDRLRHPMFEDLEFAHRLQRSCGTPVLYRPEIVVHHDHRISTADYLARERRLGLAAYELADVAPACASEVFGRDIRSDDEIAYSRAFVERERSLAQRIGATFATFDTLPAALPGQGEHGDALIQALYQQHLLLKRWTWRRGLLEAAGIPQAG